MTSFINKKICFLNKKDQPINFPIVINGACNRMNRRDPIFDLGITLLRGQPKLTTILHSNYATLFYFLDYVTHRSEKLEFQKKKKKKLPDSVGKTLLCHFQYCNFEALLDFGKLCKNDNMTCTCLYIFAIADLKNFNWCNVIQQIKKPSA